MQKTKTIMTLAMAVMLVTQGLSAATDDQKREGKQRIDHICTLYSHDENDSLIRQAPIDLEFHKDLGLWENYYETWLHLVNTYTFMGDVHTALQEVQRMHKDASDRQDTYGLALANYAMGNAYNNMGYMDDAIACYNQSICLIRKTHISPTIVSDIYSYYCDALYEQEKYEDMRGVTGDWLAYLENKLLEKDERVNEKSKAVWYAYYYLGCAQRDLGLELFDEAENDISEAEKLSYAENGDFIPMSILYYRAQLHLGRKQYRKALEYNTQRLEKSLGYDDKSSMVLIREQRAKILQGLGQYEEMAKMYKEVYELTDSIYKRDARTQIRELNTLFRVNEIKLEKRLERNRSITIIAIIIAVALALLLGYGYWMNRRLRRKNEELAIARDQAQESSKMKTDFIKNISHEIRTPLNILSGFTQVIAQPDMELPQEVKREASEKIQENTNRITTLINQLLALSESSSQTHIDRSDRISVNQLCRNAILSSGVGDTQDYQFSFDTSADDTLTIQTSERYAVSALGHLLDNAQKFTPKGGSIRMTCGKSGDAVAITVEDTGCGVPKEKADEIFGEFVQLDEYKEGVGIGLSVSRNIAHQLGGDITLDTGYTTGARFVMTLPLND